MIALLLLAGFFLLLLGLSGGGSSLSAGEPIAGTPSFLPVVLKPPPTPTATAVPPVPQFVQNIPLPNAQCPNYVAINEISDHVYIANNFSHDIAVLRGTTLLGYVPSGGEWPTRIEVDPNSSRTFVANLHSIGNVGPPSPLAEFNNGTLTRTYNQKFEGHTPLYNVTNDYLYVTDLDSNIRVFDASSSPLTFVTDIGQDQGVRGWITSITHDPVSGRVYAASWDFGEFYVISGTTVEAVRDAQAWGPASLLFDPVRNYLYVAGQEVTHRPEGYPGYNITVYNALPPYQFLGGFATAGSTTRLARDPISGYVYAINPQDDSVTIVNGLQLVGTVPTGDFPQGLAVNPNTGYVFVANSGNNTLSILKDGGMVTTIPSQGVRPFAIGVDKRDNTVYVANRGTEGDLECHHNASVTIVR